MQPLHGSGMPGWAKRIAQASGVSWGHLGSTLLYTSESGFVQVFQQEARGAWWMMERRHGFACFRAVQLARLSAADSAQRDDVGVLLEGHGRRVAVVVVRMAQPDELPLQGVGGGGTGEGAMPACMTG